MAKIVDTLPYGFVLRGFELQVDFVQEFDHYLQVVEVFLKGM